MNYFLAIDIGASSGRHMLGFLQNGQIVLEEIYRFDNNFIQKGNTFCWNVEELFANILAGIKECKTLNKIPTTIGIDTWGVDFVLLDQKDAILGSAVSYRDSRTTGMDLEVDKCISESDLYARTGIQKQPFNTIYQLMALKTQEPELLQKAQSLLFIPEYFHFLLTGVKKTEYTVASTSGLVHAQNKAWDVKLIEQLGLPVSLFQNDLHLPGTMVGEFSPAIQAQVGFNSQVILPPCHDTGSAFLAVPAKDENAIYISSGTWSLLGVELDHPITTPQSQSSNFTNEGGYDYRYRFLKNIMGLWMIQSIRRNLDKAYSFAELEEMAKLEKDFPSLVDPSHMSFFAPESMIEAVKNYCQDSKQQIPQNIGQTVQCVYRSLCQSYTDSIRELEEIRGAKFTSINIVGGGSKDIYLNDLTAKSTGLTVYAGPTEGTALGNIIAQMIAAGLFENLAQARQAIKTSFKILEFQP